MSDSVRPHRWQPTRLPHPWDSPGKNTGVGCHFLLQCMKVKSESEVTQSCPTLSDPMDCSPPGSSILGIFQARVLEWGAVASPLKKWKMRLRKMKLYDSGISPLQFFLPKEHNCSQTTRKISDKFQMRDILQNIWQLILKTFKIIIKKESLRICHNKRACGDVMTALPGALMGSLSRKRTLGGNWRNLDKMWVS